ncbi:MAG: class I SAM-dependent methyltransferase [Butyrivibrio sp.]|nr:class I SAM-dependent methyltransferase [Butyrivibrio sp.]
MGKLQGVADTLYIPLTARIQVSKRFPDFFYDEAALSLEKELPDDSIEKNSGEYFYMASVCRYHVVDAIVKAFTERHEVCNVVNLGAGLETSYFRLKPEKAFFYEMDLPEVIRTRREVLGEQERDILIEGDLFDLAWSAGIDRSLPTILTVSGVFQYFHEEKIRALIAELKDAFPKGELVFDAMNERAIAYANRYVRKTGNKNAEMFFYVDDPASFGEACGIRLIAQKAFFTEARTRLKSRLKLFTRIAMKVVDEGGRRGYILHYALQ